MSDQFIERTPQERRRKRCFHRVISGLEKGGDLRFLTLTSSNEAVNPIQQDFRRLQMRLKRRGIIKHAFVTAPFFPLGPAEELLIEKALAGIDENLFTIKP